MKYLPPPKKKKKINILKSTHPKNPIGYQNNKGKNTHIWLADHPADICNNIFLNNNNNNNNNNNAHFFPSFSSPNLSLFGLFVCLFPFLSSFFLFSKHTHTVCFFLVFLSLTSVGVFKRKKKKKRGVYKKKGGAEEKEEGKVEGNEKEEGEEREEG
jgi:hypothetical protein